MKKERAKEILAKAAPVIEWLQNASEESGDEEDNDVEVDFEIHFLSANVIFSLMIVLAVSEPSKYHRTPMESRRRLRRLPLRR